MATTKNVPRSAERATNRHTTKLTANISVAERTYTAHGAKCTGRAMFWRFRSKDGESRRELLAPFEITDVQHRRHLDVDGAPLDLYSVTTDDGRNSKQLRVHGTALADLADLRQAFAAAGPIATWPGGTTTEGGVLTQLGALINSPRWAPTVVTVETLGRIRHAGQTFFALPDVTLGAAGPVPEPSYLPERPNTNASRVSASPVRGANLDQPITGHLQAALAADPSPSTVQTAALLGWGAATCFASVSIKSDLIGGHPLLWNAGPPESGKTERGSRILTPFGVDPFNLAGSFATTTQLRDCLSATIDVPQMRDEVKLAYLPPPVKQDLPRMLKIAYNGQAVEVGGRNAGPMFRQRLVPLCPTVAFNSEGSPPQDQAVLDRLVVVPWQRLKTYPTEVQRRIQDGFNGLKLATADQRMAPVAAAWFTFAAGTDLSSPLRRARERLAGGDLKLGSRQRSNFEVVLAGLYAYAEFCTVAAPTAAPVVLELAEEFAARGIALLADELVSRQTVTGALGVLQWLAVLSTGDGPHTPRDGSEYRLAPTGLAVNAMKVLSCLRRHTQAIGTPLPDDHDFTQELKGWTGVHMIGKKRDRHATGTSNPIAYWEIPWDTLRELGGPEHSDFTTDVPF
ncbi:hypothetical protein [Blastococcus montanus]|uniref:hypothetical protein n=1 Tax=Blastococcus montanus TaxID=3144973 RepID=UPI003208CCED